MNFRFHADKVIPSLGGIYNMVFTAVTGTALFYVIKSAGFFNYVSQWPEYVQIAILIVVIVYLKSLFDFVINGRDAI